jgi:hypothetical protein
VFGVFDSCFSCTEENLLISLEKAADEVKFFEDLRRATRKLNATSKLNKGPNDEEAKRISIQLLDLDKEMDLMKKMKHIQRELNVILKVLKDQERVIEQMIELLTDEPLKYPSVVEGSKIAELAEKRRKKLKKREEQIMALNLKAEHTSADVSDSRRNDSLWFY